MDQDDPPPSKKKANDPSDDLAEYNLDDYDNDDAAPGTSSSAPTGVVLNHPRSFRSV